MASVLPPVLWRNGLRGWIALVLCLPFFLLFFALTLAIWLPLGTAVVAFDALSCSGVKLGRFMNIAILAVDVVMGWLYTQNPLCPHAVPANVGKWLFVIFMPILWAIGRCFDVCRKRKAKAEGIEEEVPAADEDFKEVRVSDSVSILSAKFSEGLETACAMTVIRGDDWVMFYNPIFAPLSTYKKYGEGKRRVVMFLPTIGHHMAADLCVAAYPNVEIFGSTAAGARHVPALSVKNPSEEDLGIPGFQHFDVSATVYDEHWLFYEPAGLLLLGDFMPHLEDSADLNPCLRSCFTRLGRCCSKSSMMNYSKSLVTNPDVVQAALRKILKLNIKRIEGAHDADGLDSAGTREDPRKAFIEYWYWLMPQDLANEMAVELV